MKFKDNLKALRLERGLTQREVGEQIFVSRSAVAKWENGLGLPSAASYEALLNFFGIDRDALPLNEEEEIGDIKKNRRVHFIKSVLCWVLILALAVSPFLFIWAIKNGYGFTSEMAAGDIWVGDEVISTPDYDFYYFANIHILGEDGEIADRVIDGFCVVQKRFCGYQKLESEDFKRRVYTSDGELFGILYTFEGDECYYNLFKSVKTLKQNESEELGAVMEINLLPEVFVDGERIEVTLNSYFVTEGFISEFDTAEHHLTVK